MKHFILLPIFFSLIFITVYGATDHINHQANLAEAYYTTGQYQEALEAYESLLVDDLPEWKKQFVRYDMATTLIKLGEWDNAEKMLNQIRFGSDPNPILVRNTEFNRVLIYIQQAEDIIKQSWNAELLLNDALLSLNIIKKTDCDIAKIFGYDNCEVKPEILVLQEKIKRLLNKSAQNTQAHAITNVDTPQAVLENSINALNQFQQLTSKISNPKNSQDINLKNSLFESQVKTQVSSAAFIPTTLKFEKVEFENHICQEHPWDQVIPLFHSGDQALKNVKEELKKSYPSWEMIKTYQKEAFQAWKRALDRLKNFKSSSEKEKNIQEPQEINKLSPSEQMLQLLEQMFQEDEVGPMIKPEQKRVLRPW